jgi:hypothetical protein
MKRLYYFQIEEINGEYSHYNELHVLADSEEEAKQLAIEYADNFYASAEREDDYPREGDIQWSTGEIDYWISVDPVEIDTIRVDIINHAPIRIPLEEYLVKALGG